MAGAPRVVFVFTPEELPGCDVRDLPVRLRASTFFLLDERHVYASAAAAIHVPLVVDGRGVEGRAVRWLAKVGDGLPVHVWFALGWDRSNLSGGWLKGYFDERKPQTVRRTFARKGFTCLGPEILAGRDAERLAVPPESMVR